MRIFKKKSQVIDKSFINKAVIGLGYGLVRTKDLILNKSMSISPQDAMDALSVWIGRELMKEMLEKKIVNVRDSDETIINGLMDVINLAEELDVEVSENLVKIIVQKCLICPKRIGGYDLEGYTACPVGGVLTGAISYIRGTDPHILKNRLQTAEICHIEMEL